MPLFAARWSSAARSQLARVRPAARQLPDPRRRSFQTAVGTHLLKGPPAFVPENNAWVQESVRGFTLVHAHPWYTDQQSNDEVDNSVDGSALLAGRRVAIFGVPAPFTGTCTTSHVPGYQALQVRGNDAFSVVVAQ
jgi:hypothetical protein